jgi:2-polyprenyl-3-methyl-5-hydroxy-6-metoxy-1,4-benzoquinol methylase
LEIGVSELLPLYKKLIPHISLVTIDRPTEWYGFDAEYCINIGKVDRHYNIDLNKEQLSKDFVNPPLGMFDYIVCAEILEHLVVNSVDFLADLIGLPNPTCYLYLITPNFFPIIIYKKLRDVKIRNIFKYIYPRQGENWDVTTIIGNMK